MQKYISRFLSVVLISVFFAIPLTAVRAALLPIDNPSTGNFGLTKVKDKNVNIGLGDTDPIDVVFNVVKIALGLLGLIAVVLILYAGFLWMTAGGNAEQIKKAKGIMKNGAIGLAIVLAAAGITNFVVENIKSVTSTG